MGKLITCLIFFIGLVVIFDTAHAEDDVSKEKSDINKEEDLQGTTIRGVQLGEIVVTSTRKQARALDVPASVTIITAEDIENNGYRSVSEVIGSLPGVINQSHSESYSFDFRGTKSSDSHGPHILIDGREVNLGLFGFNIIGSIPLETIERIEVIRTPGAYISGRDSSRGVINIITKKGEKKDKAFNSQVNLSYGSWNTYAVSMAASGKLKKLDYYLDAAYKESEGYRHTEPVYGFLLGKVGYAITDSLRLGVDVQYNNESRYYGLGLDQWQLDEGYRRASEIPSSQTASSAYMKKQNSIENEVISGTFSLDYNAYPYRAGLSFNVSDYSDTYEVHTYDNSATSKKYNYEKDRTQDIYEAKLFFERSFTAGPFFRDSIEIGYDTSWREGEQDTSYLYDDTAADKENAATIDYEEQYHSIFLNNEAAYGRFSLGTGARYEYTKYELSSEKPDRMTSDFNKVAWNAAASFEILKKQVLYCNVSTSYFYPTAAYFYYAMDYESEDNQPEDLKPEETLSYEIGIKHDLADWLRYNITFFYMDIQDRFLSFYNDSGSWVGWKNVGDSTNKGIELEIKGQVFSWFEYNTSFTYLDAVWDSGSLLVYEYGTTPSDDVKEQKDVSGKTVSGIPTYQSRIVLTFIPPVAGLRCSIGFTHIGEKYIDSWNRYKTDPVNLFDAKIIYKRKNWSIYVSGENIFDVEYEKVYNTYSARNSDGTPDNSYYPQNGRYIEVGGSLVY